MDAAGPSVLLVGPYDPFSGEYTFLAPPLGVWRLKGVLTSHGFYAEVFDPNCVDEGSSPEQTLAELLIARRWDVIGFSTTGMTLQWDLSLTHQARSSQPGALLIGGGMEATFNVEQLFELAPFDLMVLGEGEKPMLELLSRVSRGAPWTGIPGTAWINSQGDVQQIPQPAMGHDDLRDAIFATPYDEMPYEKYWSRLEAAYRIGALPSKAAREARLAEIRSVRLITLNYCPMGCTFCSSTNFLNAAQAGTARLARLDVAECIRMIERIVEAHPSVRTIIFQDDIFVFRADARILPLAKALRDARESESLPKNLQFISTNRIDSMTPERLAAMRDAGFRVLGFGIESFSPAVLEEFNKGRIHSHVVPVLEQALELGVTPFLDVILTSPRCSLPDLAETIRQGFRWIKAGCEVGMYPYVIPFSGAAMSTDPALQEQVVTETRHVQGTTVRWEQPAKILPFDERVREAIVEIEELFEERLARLQDQTAHLPSRVRSLLWIASAIPILRVAGEFMPPEEEAIRYLLENLPGLSSMQRKKIAVELGASARMRASH